MIKLKKLLAVVLTFTMVLTLMNVTAFAALSTHCPLSITVVKLQKSSTGYLGWEQVDSTSVVYDCEYGVGHSGYNHIVSLKNFYPTNFGWSAGSDWLGYCRSQTGYSQNPMGKFYTWQSVTLDFHASISGSSPYRAAEKIYLYYDAPAPAKQTLTLSYNKNANDATGSTASQSQTVNVGNSATFIVSGNGFNRTGYTFQGWAESPTGPVRYQPGSQITIFSNTTLYAVWAEDPPAPAIPMPDVSVLDLKARFIDDTGVHSTVIYSLKPLSQNYRSLEWIEGSTEATVTVHGNYWISKVVNRDMGGVSHALVGEQEKTIQLSYADGQWTAIPAIVEFHVACEVAFTLHYDKNAGNDEVTGMPQPNPIEVTEVAENHTFFLDTTATPLREGYTFKGWGASSDATAPIESIVCLANQTVTVYAIWEPVSSPDPGPEPTYDELNALIKVLVYDMTGNELHGQHMFDLKTGSYDISTPDDGRYTVTVQKAPYVEAFNNLEQAKGVGHSLVNSDPYVVVVEKDSNGVWKVFDQNSGKMKNSSTVSIGVKCPTGSSLTVTKTRTSGDNQNQAGDTITWDITIKNTSGIDASVTVKDVLSNAAGSVTLTYDNNLVSENQALTVPAGSSITVQASYTIQEGDAGKTLQNTAIVTNQNDANPDSSTAPGPKDYSATEDGSTTVPNPEPVPEAHGDVSVEKALDGDKTEFTPGESVTWTITVNNNSENDTMVNVDDLLDGVVLKKDGSEVRNPIEVKGNSSVTLTAEYTIPDDAKPGHITNTVTVTDVGPDGVPNNDPTGNPDPIDTATNDKAEVVSPDPTYQDPTVTKALNDADKVYGVGETITWTITITNPNADEIAVNVVDNLAGATLTYEGAAVSNPVKVPGDETVTLTASYTVTREDIINGRTIANSVTVTDDKGTPEDSSDDTTVPATSDSDPTLQQPVTVTYHVEGGTWSDGTTEDKTETIIPGEAPSNIPTANPNEGHSSSGSWNPDPNTAESVTEDTTFTLTFPEDTPTEPDVLFRVTVQCTTEGTEHVGQTLTRELPGTISQEGTTASASLSDQAIDSVIGLFNTQYGAHETDSVTPPNPEIELTWQDGKWVRVDEPSAYMLARSAGVPIATPKAISSDSESGPIIVVVAVSVHCTPEEPITVTKTLNGDTSTVYGVGDPISWTITITNPNVDAASVNVVDNLSGVVLTDVAGNTVSNPVEVTGNGTVTLTATYTVTREDILNGSTISNSVTVTDTRGTPEDPSDDVPYTETSDSNPTLQQPVTVTYHVEGGTWSDGTTEDKTVTIIPGETPIDIPAATPNEGFTGTGTWNIDPSIAGPVTEDTTFTLTFDPDTTGDPGTPGTPGTPGDPGTPDAPDTPDVPDIPATPDEPDIPDEPEVDIPDENPPLAENPEEPNNNPNEPTVDIPDENPPLADTPDAPEDNPSVDEPTVDIPDENPPLAENPDTPPAENPTENNPAGPEDEPPVDIPDENPPLAEDPVVIIPDENVPMDQAPQTADATNGMIWAGLLICSAFGLAVIFLKKKESN